MSSGARSACASMTPSIKWASAGPSGFVQNPGSRGKLYAHGGQLLDPHSVLSGDGTAQVHTGFQDVGSEQLAAAHLVRRLRIEQNQGMQVAVAGGENIDATQAVLALHLLDGVQHLRQA